MTIQTKYITPDELFSYSGINFEKALQNSDNPSDTVEAFINRVEVRMETFLNANFFKNITEEWYRFSDYQKLHYKYALMEQCIYVFRNSDLSTDSGYEPESGEVINIHKLHNLSIAPNAREHLELCGLWSAHIGPTATNGIFPDWWFKGY